MRRGSPSKGPQLLLPSLHLRHKPLMCGGRHILLRHPRTHKWSRHHPLYPRKVGLRTNVCRITSAGAPSLESRTYAISFTIAPRDREAPSRGSRDYRDARDRDRDRVVNNSNEDAAYRDRDGRREYVDPARGYDSRGVRRHSSGSSRRHDYPAATPSQPQYAAAGAYAPQRAYDNAQPQPSGRRAAPGTRAEPIYVDDNAPDVPHASRPYRSHHSGEKRTRDGASPPTEAEQKKKWWHGPSAW